MGIRIDLVECESIGSNHNLVLPTHTELAGSSDNDVLRCLNYLINLHRIQLKKQVSFKDVPVWQHWRTSEILLTTLSDTRNATQDSDRRRDAIRDTDTTQGC